MTKPLMFIFSLVSLLAIGCGKSACEEAYDIALECGEATPDQMDSQIALCESLLPEDVVKSCLDCTNDAPDPCTASDTGGPCEAACNFSL